MANTRFQKLLEPGYIGSVRTRNRMLKTGAQPGFFPSPDGNVTQQLKDYYNALARGGAGIVTVAGGGVQFPKGSTLPGRYRVDDDKFIPGLKELAQTIQKYECPAFLQLMSQGPMRRLQPPGSISVGASAITKDEIPVAEFSPVRELSIAEIEEIVKGFADIAERAHKAGFQGIELNGGCNHLLNSFLSRFWNKRRDAYGGSLENRAKIYIDIIKEIKRRNGKDFAVIALFNGAEPRLANGITSEESQELAKLAQAAGADAIHVRVEFYTPYTDPAIRDSTHFPDIALYPEIPVPLGADIDTSQHGRGGWVPLAAAVKKAVPIPIIAIGKLDAEIGEKIIRQCLVDFISLNRRLMVDHDYPNKIITGKLDEIVPCTGCFTCFDANERRQPPLCQVNAALGREGEFEIKPADKKKRVMVIGGGPAGMETARVAALRGHSVMLYEKESKLGGSIPLAAMVKGFEREDILSLISYLSSQMGKLGVDVKLGKEVDRSVVEQVKPDVLVIATGGTHNVPALPGINSHKVVSSKALHKQLKGYLKFFGPKTLHRLSKFWMPIGKQVVIMGGNIQGCQVAAFLVKRGRKVTIVETADKIGDGLLIVMVKPLLLDWLGKKGTTMITEAKYDEVTDKGLTITTKDGKKQTIEADTIITALPLLPNTEFIKSLGKVVPEVYAIGDCNEPRLIVNAIADGSKIGRAI
ncbi:MAG: FAD-dependent oxidoreductase [Chloroflexota bacterium]